jgi:histidinol-phosphate aminotransferase
MEGYVPGEQPKMANLVKLNTNENPFAPSPEVEKVLRNFSIERMRRYPDPRADGLRCAVAERNKIQKENVIVGNGSDDILTMIFRAFTSPDKPMAMLYPSYSLYAELAAMQGAEVIRVPLSEKTFELPDELLSIVQKANLLMITRPNAPTGNSFDFARVKNICEKFDGIVVIDEAYADFAQDNCMELAKTLPNVIVMRTFSKSYALAGLRLGYAVSSEKIIEGLMKLKDSYNVDMLSQEIAIAAYNDTGYFSRRVSEVKEMRAYLKNELEALGFYCVDSSSNFIFAMPPDEDGERCFKLLRDEAVIVRYFSADVTKKYVRITIGNPAENARLLEVLKGIYA